MPQSDKNMHQNVPNCSNLKTIYDPLAQRIPPPSKFTHMKQMIAQLPNPPPPTILPPFPLCQLLATPL